MKYGSIKQFQTKVNKWLTKIIFRFLPFKDQLIFSSICRLFREIVYNTEEFHSIRQILRKFKDLNNKNLFFLLQQNAKVITQIVKEVVYQINHEKSNLITGLKASVVLSREEIESIVFILLGKTFKDHVVLQDFSSSKSGYKIGRYRLRKNCLNYEQMYIRSLGVSYLSFSLLEFQNLQVLNLHKCFIGPLGVDYLCSLIEQVHSIVHLDLSENLVGTMGLFSLSNLLSKPNCKLRFLSVDQNITKETSLLYLIRSLKSNKNLRKLVCSFGDFNYDMAFYKRLSEYCSLNRRIVFKISSIDRNGIMSEELLWNIIQTQLMKEVNLSLECTFQTTKVRPRKLANLINQKLFCHSIKLNDNSIFRTKYSNPGLTHHLNLRYIYFNQKIVLHHQFNQFRLNNLFSKTIYFSRCLNEKDVEKIKRNDIVTKLSIRNPGDVLRKLNSYLIKTKSLEYLEIFSEDNITSLYMNRSIKNLKIGWFKALETSLQLLVIRHNILSLTICDPKFNNISFRKFVKIMTQPLSLKFLKLANLNLHDSVKGFHIYKLLRKTKIEWISIPIGGTRISFLLKGLKSAKYLKRYSILNILSKSQLERFRYLSDSIEIIDFNYTSEEVFTNEPKIKHVLMDGEFE